VSAALQGAQEIGWHRLQVSGNGGGCAAVELFVTGEVLMRCRADAGQSRMRHHVAEPGGLRESV